MPVSHLSIRMMRFCPTCGRPFVPAPSNARRGWGIYCSQHCRKHPDLSERNRTADYSKRKPLPHAYKKGNVPWNKGLVGCFTPDVVAKIRQYRMKQKLPREDTAIERMMQAALDKEGLIYKHPFPFGQRCLIDFAFPDQMLAVECDGKYWHSLDRNKRADANKSELLNRNGWKLLRFTEDEIESNLPRCVEQIKEVIVHRA